MRFTGQHAALRLSRGARLGVSFDQKDGVNIMKSYMEGGEFARSRESIRADGGVIMVGHFDVDVSHQQRVGHLFGTKPPEMRDDTTLMDRIHAYLPGWDVLKLSAAHFTDHFGLVSDFLAECWHQLRFEGRWARVSGRMRLGETPRSCSGPSAGCSS